MNNLRFRVVFPLLTALSFLSVLVVNVSAQTKPTKLQCVKSLNLTVPQKEELLKIKNEVGESKKQKLEQFIVELTPMQRQELKACLKASK